mgnify:CR=1 FL=1
MSIEPSGDGESADNAEDPPVTVMVIRPVAPERRPAFEELLTTVMAQSRQAEGHLGVEVYRPTGDERDYRIVFRFDQQSRMEAWRSHSQTQGLLSQLDAYTEGGAAQMSVYTGLETWFTLPVAPGRPPPPRWKMALLTWVGLFPTVLLVVFVTSPLQPYLPYPVPYAIVTSTAVVLMTWVVMPRVTRLFARFLWPVG